MHPISPVWVSACLAEARDPGSAIVNEYTPVARALPVDPAGQLFRVEPGGGARLGRRGGARRQARRARPPGHRGPGRRLVPLRQPGRGAPRLDPAPPAGAVRRRQQRDVGRGAPRDPRHVPARAKPRAATARPSSTSTNCRPSSRSAPRPAATASASRTRPNCRPRSNAPCTPSTSKSARPCST